MSGIGRWSRARAALVFMIAASGCPKSKPTGTIGPDDTQPSPPTPPKFEVLRVLPMLTDDDSEAIPKATNKDCKITTGLDLLTFAGEGGEVIALERFNFDWQIDSYTAGKGNKIAIERWPLPTGRPAGTTTAREDFKGLTGNHARPVNGSLEVSPNKVQVGNAGAFALVLDVIGHGRQVELAQGGVDVAVGAGAEADAEQIAQTPAGTGIDVGLGQVAAPEEAGDGRAVMRIGLGLVAVDGFHPPGVSEDEGDVLLGAGVGEPVPGVDALAGDDESLAEGGDSVEKDVGACGHVEAEADRALAIEDDGVRGSCVQVDAAVVSRVG
jgi:hypothetical protein